MAGGRFRWITAEGFTQDGWLAGQPNDSEGIEAAVIYMGNPTVGAGIGWSDCPFVPSNVSWHALPRALLLELDP